MSPWNAASAAFCVASAAVAGDIGGGVRGRWIDLGFDDWNYEGWHKQVMVYFLTPVPPASQITWIIPSTIP